MIGEHEPRQAMPVNQDQPFRIALTADFFDHDGNPKYKDLGLSVFDGHAHIEYFAFDAHKPQIAPDQLRNANGVIVLGATVTADSLAAADDLLAVVRFGVGYDSVDVGACTDADVLLIISRGAVDRPVAEATVGWMIALTHNLLAKDRLVREGDWDARNRYMGAELRDRTFGAVGLGGIATHTMRLLSIFGMKPPIAFDPYVDPDAARPFAELVELDELMGRADFVSIHCPLTDETRGLIGARELALMRPDSYLINTARGGIVVEDALYDALEQGRIAGAALDCFEQEPVVTPHRFGGLDNVILAPHSIAWTNELFRDIGRMNCQSLLDLSLGKVPHGMVNAEVLERPGFQAKWKRWRGG